jgi:hypothetical protein
MCQLESKTKTKETRKIKRVQRQVMKKNINPPPFQSETNTPSPPDVPLDSRRPSKQLFPREQEERVSVREK